MPASACTLRRISLPPMSGRQHGTRLKIETRTPRSLAANAESSRPARPTARLVRRLPVSAVADGDGRRDTLSDSDAAVTAYPGVTPPDTGDDGRDELAAPATITSFCTSAPVAVQHTVACPPQSHDRLPQATPPVSFVRPGTDPFSRLPQVPFYGAAALVLTPERTDGAEPELWRHQHSGLLGRPLQHDNR